jgi:hypothetical protein
MITQYTLQIQGLENEQDLAQLKTPFSFVIDSELNKPTLLSLRYSATLRPESFHKKDAIKFPTSLSLVVTESLEEEGAEPTEKEICIFRGLSHQFQMNYNSNESFLENQYIDPLITTFELNEPSHWHDQQLDAIVDSLFKSSYSAGTTNRSLKSEFRGKTIPKPHFVTDTGFSKFDFLNQIVHGVYGYSFYFDPTLDKEDKVVFFRPEIKPENFRKMNAAEIFSNPFQFKAHINKPLSAAFVHNSSSSQHKELKSLQGQLSLTGQSLAKTRAQNGVELVSHFYFPNEEESFCAALAESKLQESIINSHHLVFKSRNYYPLGTYLQVDSDELSSPAFLEGYYLITHTKHAMTHGHWTHEYTGVRG